MARSMSERTLSGVELNPSDVVSSGGVFRKRSELAGTPNSPGGPAAPVKIKRRRPQDKVQIKCPVGSPASFIVPRKVSVNEDYARTTFHQVRGGA